MAIEDQGTPWSPTEQDLFKGGDGYFRYAAGLVMLNNPDLLQDLHQRDLEDEQQKDQILVHAQTLIWAGLSDVIRYANPPNLRRLVTAEHNHANALKEMVGIADHAIDTNRQRFAKLNGLISLVRPLPVVDEAVYKHITHGRKAKVQTWQTMDMFTIDDRFGDGARSKTFEEVPRTTIDRRARALKVVK